MDCTDEPWDVLKPSMPVPSRRSDGRGRPWRDLRAVLNGRLWIRPTGAPWQAWPPRDPPDQTCHRRLHHGVRSDIFARILQVLATDLQERGTLARSDWCIDGTCVVANTGGSGGERRRGARVRRSWPEPTGLVVLSPSTLRRLRRMQSTVLEPTLAAGVVDAQPARWMGDTADESAPLDAYVAEPGIEWIIPHRSNRNTPKPHDDRPWRRDARCLQLERGETPGSARARFQQPRLRTLSFQARMSGQQLKGAAMWCKPIGKVRDMADQIKSHMLAAVVPAKGERWQLQEVPVPELLPTQVLVKVCASGISYADVEQTRGELPGHFPRILGHEVAGDVLAVGDAVTADDCILTWSGTLRRHDARQ